MRRLEGLGDLLRDRERFGDGQPSPLQALGQVFALDQLQDEEGPRPSRASFEAVDRGDVRVVERGEQLRLALEAGQALGIGRATSAGSTLIATSRPSFVSVAR